MNAKLLASYALFTELFNKNLSLYAVIAHLIKITIIFKKINCATSNEIYQYFKEIFEFTIPEPVIKSSLNRLGTDILTKTEAHIYFFNINKIENKETIVNELPQIEKTHEEIFSNLITYIKTLNHLDFIDDSKQSMIFDCFSSILLKNKFENEELSSQVNAFILENKNDLNFTNSLNAIKEGLVLYMGLLSHSNDLNNLNSYPSKMTIFLATEHLFSINGYNGIYFKERICDFLNIIKTINTKCIQKNNGEPIIRLKYFNETQKEIEDFFSKFTKTQEYSKINFTSYLTPAAKYVIKFCTCPSDFIKEQAKFFTTLKNLGIFHDDKDDYFTDNNNAKYNLSSEEKIKNLIEYFKDTKIHNNRKLIENSICDTLRFFSKINILRKGVNSKKIEDCKFIYVSDSKIAFDILQFENEYDHVTYPIIFLDTLVESFWFKFNDGFSKKIPKSLDIITRTQIAFSSIIETSVVKKYEETKSLYDNKKITEEEMNMIIGLIISNSSSITMATKEDIRKILKFITETPSDIVKNIERLKQTNSEKDTKIEDLQSLLTEKTENLSKASYEMKNLNHILDEKTENLSKTTKEIKEIKPKLDTLQSLVLNFIRFSTIIIFTFLISSFLLFLFYIIAYNNILIDTINISFLTFKCNNYFLISLLFQAFFLFFINKYFYSKKSILDKKIFNYILN